MMCQLIHSVGMATKGISVKRPSSLLFALGLSTAMAMQMVNLPTANAASLEYNVASSFRSQGDCKVVPAVPQGGVGSGGGCFAHDGDYFVVADSAKDGKSVGVYWQTSGGRSGICRNASGFDSVKYRGRQCDKDFPEGETLVMRAGFCSTSAINTCKKYSDYTSWGVPVRTWTHKGGAW